MNSEEPHVGSIDVDLALDAAKLNDGRYAELVKLLLDTRRYRPGEKELQRVVAVDLNDGVAKAIEILPRSLSAWMLSAHSNWSNFTPRRTPTRRPCMRGVLTNWCRSS